VRRLEKRRVLLEPRPDDQVRLLVELAQIVVEPARARVRPVDDLVDGRQPLGLFRNAADRRESLRQPQSGMSRVSSVAPRSTPMAWYLGTLVCMRMLANSESASSKTRSRRSVATRWSAVSTIACASSMAATDPFDSAWRSTSIARRSRPVS
jgi:hypothetical protein